MPIQFFAKNLAKASEQAGLAISVRLLTKSNKVIPNPISDGMLRRQNQMAVLAALLLHYAG